jgi:hypothetical protein
MDSIRFNRLCRSLPRDQFVRISLLDGTSIDGLPIRHIEATTLDGSIELQTQQGFVRLLSSAIVTIEPLGDQLA